MIAKSNARWNEQPESGTIFTIENKNLIFKVHRIHGIDDRWYVSCHNIGIKDRELVSRDLIEAIREGKMVVNDRITKYLVAIGSLTDNVIIE